MTNKVSSLFTALILSTTLLVPSISLAQGEAKSNNFWWPEQLNLQPLRQHAIESNPLGDDFNYAVEFSSLDLDVLKEEIEGVMKETQEWWPADYGHYGPFFYSHGLA